MANADKIALCQKKKKSEPNARCCCIVEFESPFLYLSLSFKRGKDMSKKNRRYALSTVEICTVGHTIFLQQQSRKHKVLQNKKKERKSRVVLCDQRASRSILAISRSSKIITIYHNKGYPVNQ